MCHPPGSHEEAPETERRWSERGMWARVFTVVAIGRNGQKKVSCLGLAGLMISAGCGVEEVSLVGLYLAPECQGQVDSGPDCGGP